ncbi:MAG: hypothetical protein DA330_05015 [Nitrososphaera sp.]|nr:hypothetical protein [Nitrososphaera sp.]
MLTEGEMWGIFLGISALVAAVTAIIDSRRSATKIEKISGATLRVAQFGKEVKAFPRGMKETDFPLELDGTKNETLEIHETVVVVITNEITGKKRTVTNIPIETKGQ